MLDRPKSKHIIQLLSTEALVTLPLLFSLSAAQLVAWQGTIGAQVETNIAIVSDTTKSPQDRLAAYNKLYDLPEGTRRGALLRVVESANGAFASMAASRLIAEHVGAVVPILVSRFETWAWRDQWAVLGNIQSYGPESDFRIFARLVLNKAAVAGFRFKEESEEGHATSLAAVILQKKQDPSDEYLIKRALKAQSALSCLWLVRVNYGALDEDEARNAEVTLADESAPVTLRLAVAVGLAPRNVVASRFVDETTGTFLRRYADFDAEHAVIEALHSANGSPQAENADALGPLRFKVLGVLQYLITGNAEKYTFEFLSAKNEFIRKTLGVIAAIRWPRRLLSEGRQKLSEVEFINLVAVASRFHPNLDVSEAQVSAKSMRAAQSKLRTMGMDGLFFRSAAAAFGL